MRRVLYAAVVVVAVLGAVLGTDLLQPVAIAQKDGTLVRTAVVGVDTSISRAENAAKRSAYEVARGNYRTISNRTVRSGMLYTCTIVIEYRIR